MRNKIQQILFLIFSLLFSANAIAQDVFEINLSIVDTLVIKKKAKNSSKYAVKVNVVINVPMLQDSVVLHSFNKYVSSHFFSLSNLQLDRYKEISIGLMYVIEDKEGKIITAHFALVSYEDPKVDIRIRDERIFLSPKLKIERRLLTEQEQRDYDIAKYVIRNKKQSLELYPLLGEYHFNLPKGEYYLYFVYSDYNPRVPPPDMRVEGKLDDGNIFRGYFVSNKVKLIVE